MSLASTSSADPWDAPAPAPRPAAPVRDAWDASDDEDSDADDPQTVWETANKQTPLPELVVAARTAPPPAALQPGIRILKRPAAAAAPAPTRAPEQKTFAARAAEYEAARRRIFQDGAEGGAAEPVVKIVREPRGPAEDGAQRTGAEAGPSKGFAGRRTPNSGEGAAGGESAAGGGAA